MINLDIKYLEKFINDSDFFKFEDKLKIAVEKLENENDLSNGKGWLNLPINLQSTDIIKIKSFSEKIKKKFKYLIILGIGGSYLGTKASINFLSEKYLDYKDAPKIIFSGDNLNSYLMNKVLNVCKTEDACLCVISKSGSTIETSIAFRILRDTLEKRYGKSKSKDIIFCITDNSKGNLKKLCCENKYKYFDIPYDIGGRYSVLTNVGLIPLSIMGIDISKIISGALDAYHDFKNCSFENLCYKYAVIRNILYSKGKFIEIISGYDPCLKYLFEWWKQLFGESEGKCQKGIFPSSAIFTSDLHSMGQFIQEGNPILFETTLTIKNNFCDILIPKCNSETDSLKYLENKSINFINQKAFEGTIKAHAEENTPNIHIEIDKKDEYNLGYLIYFFEKSCAISSYIMGVNPFNQPGVEAYKKNMFQLLNN